MGSLSWCPDFLLCFPLHSAHSPALCPVCTEPLHGKPAWHVCAGPDTRGRCGQHGDGSRCKSLSSLTWTPRVLQIWPVVATPLPSGHHPLLFSPAEQKESKISKWVSNTKQCKESYCQHHNCNYLNQLLLYTATKFHFVPFLSAQAH